MRGRRHGGPFAEREPDDLAITNSCSDTRADGNAEPIANGDTELATDGRAELRADADAKLSADSDAELSADGNAELRTHAPAIYTTVIVSVAIANACTEPASNSRADPITYAPL